MTTVYSITQGRNFHWVVARCQRLGLSLFALGLQLGQGLRLQIGLGLGLVRVRVRLWVGNMQAQATVHSTK